jgi:hypothetical protein
LTWGEDEWADVGAVIFFWVRLSQMEMGMDERPLSALRAWFNEEWKLDKPSTSRVGSSHSKWISWTAPI